MREIVAIWYRGTSYQIGRGRDFYGIWPAGEQVSQPVERWSLTRDGWYGAWARFTAIEAPGTIVPASPPAAGPQSSVTPAGPQSTAPPQAPVVLPGDPPVSAPAGLLPGGLTAQDTPAAGGQRGNPFAGASLPAVIAAVLLAVGVTCGVAGLFPGYLGGASLASEPNQLVTHVIYLAGWSVSALLILLGGGRARMGALLGLGLSAVTFGFFLADLGTVIAGGMHLMGAGLVLGLVGWLFCAAGSVAAFLLLRTGAPGWPRGYRVDSVLILTLAGIGAAIAFAPSWDSFTLQTPSGFSRTVTAGNAFANPAPVIAGDVAVMVALVAVVAAAAVWRPVRHGAALLAGAIVPMAAQAISALVQVAEGASPAQFGIPPAQAAQAGLTISSGVTAAFWIYCAFVIALAVMCARMLIGSRSGRPGAVPAGPVRTDAGPPAGLLR